MRVLLRNSAALLILFGANALFAQSLFIGESTPLTGVRYAAKTGSPQLVSNGSETFLFWRSATHLHFHRPSWGASTPSRALMTSTGMATYEIAWTGSRFLVVQWQTHYNPSRQEIIGALFDINGEAIGEPFMLVDGGMNPKIAFDGESVLLLFYDRNPDFDAEAYAVRLTRDGKRPDSSPSPTGVRGMVQSLASNGRSFAAVVSDRFERKLVMFNKKGEVTAKSPLVTDFTRVGRIAGSADGYLIVDAAGNTIQTHLVKPDGSLGAPLTLEPAAAEGRAASVAWTGAKWVVAYQAPGYGNPLFSILHIDAANTAVESREMRSGADAAVASTNKRVAVAWNPQGSPNAIHFGELPLEGTAGVPTSFAATTQNVMATASSTHGALFLWTENTTLHAGVRTREGRWTEEPVWHELVSGATAASNGDTFGIVVRAASRSHFLHLDRQGKPIGQPLPLGDRAVDRVFWTGRSYALLDGKSIAALGSDGTLSPWVDVAPSMFGSPFAIAGGPDEFLAVWVMESMFLCPPGPPEGIAAIRLGADFQPLDAEPMKLVDARKEEDWWLSSASVVRDGKQYVVTWSSEKGLVVAHIPTGGGTPVRRIVDEGISAEAKLIALPRGTGIFWSHYENYNEDPSHRYRIVYSNGSMSSAITTKPSSGGSARYEVLPEMVTLPNGDVALVETRPQDNAPFEGSVRLTGRAISTAPLPQRPQAPAVTVAQNGNTIRLQWSAVPQPVNGYRVEYRIENQPWVEIDRVLSPDQFSVSLLANAKPTIYRVRAWNDGGLGTYSSAAAPTTTQSPRRRSVR